MRSQDIMIGCDDDIQSDLDRFSRNFSMCSDAVGIYCVDVEVGGQFFHYFTVDDYDDGKV